MICTQAMMEVCNPGVTGPLFWVPYRNVTEHKHQHEISEYFTYQHYSTRENHSQILKELFIPEKWNPYQ